MSKKQSEVSGQVISPGWGYGYVIEEDAPNRLFGTIFNVIEALGLPERQEEALKPLIRKQIWEIFESAVYITDKRHSEIRELYYQKRRESNNGSLPMSAV